MAAMKASPASLLTPEQLAAMDDDEFFEAYAAGRVARRADTWTEENWEEVNGLRVLTHLVKEMEKTPMFMTKAPTMADIENNPQLKALQDIISEFEPDGLATCAVLTYSRGCPVQQISWQRLLCQGEGF